jgi:hypothetical protein
MGLTKYVMSPIISQQQQHRNYNRFDIQQLHNDVLVQDWSAIFDLLNPDQQLQHFNNIVKSNGY